MIAVCLALMEPMVSPALKCANAGTTQNVGRVTECVFVSQDLWERDVKMVNTLRFEF